MLSQLSDVLRKLSDVLRMLKAVLSNARCCFSVERTRKKLEGASQLPPVFPGFKCK